MKEAEGHFTETFFLSDGKMKQLTLSESTSDKDGKLGTSLVVQWLSLHTPNAEGLGFDPWSGNDLHVPQLRVHTWQLKVLSHVLQLRPETAK